MTTPKLAMERAISISRRGFPAPNPHVGCVLVKDDQFIGEGWHEFAGGPHAEIMALADAASNGKSVAGATAFVTLEPCNHTGRTGPCSQALINAGVEKVVIACLDPNPQAAGGVSALQAAGIIVETGLCDHEAREANSQFLYSQSIKRPLITVKVAMTLDGKIALPSGESKWITGERARRDVHTLRAQRGSVLVGRKTAEVDQARLTVRGIDGVKNQPIRIVIDPELKLDSNLPIFNQEAPTMRISGDLHSEMKSLFQNGIRGVLVEGGPFTITKFLETDLVDELIIYTAPIILGEGKCWVEAYGMQTLSDPKRWTLVNSDVFGEDTKSVYCSGNLVRFLAS